MTKLALLALVGCIGRTEIDFSLHGNPSATVYDDGAELIVTGCDGKLLCGNSGVMTVTTNGTTVGVPLRNTITIGGIVELFNTFAGRVDRPSDGTVGVAINGAAAVIAELPAFTLAAPSGNISRGAGPIALAWAADSAATAEAYVTGTC